MVQRGQPLTSVATTGKIHKQKIGCKENLFLFFSFFFFTAKILDVIPAEYSPLGAARNMLMSAFCATN